MANEIIPIQLEGVLSVADLEPKPKMFEGKPTTNGQGLPVYKVDIEVKYPTCKKIVNVEVPASENPVAKIKLDQPVKLVNLCFNAGVSTAGKWWKFTADEIKAA